MLQAIFLSFFSPNLYRDVAARWGGNAFLYLLLLLCLSWVYAVVEWQILLNVGVKNITLDAAALPIMKIQKGIIETPENRPYIIYDSKNKPGLIIDTSGKYPNLDATPANILVTKDKIFTRADATDSVRITKLSESVNTEIHPTVIMKYIKDFAGYTWILMFIGAVLLSYVYRIIQALLYSLLGLLFRSIWRVPLSYGQVLQIVIVALTPAIVVSTVIDALHYSFNFQYTCFFLISLFYIFFGVYANKNTLTRFTNNLEG